MIALPQYAQQTGMRGVYTLRRLVIRKVLSKKIWGVPRPAWAVGNYSSGPPTGGTPQILVDKTLRMTSRLRV